jgi:3'-phosphoadenosine 5'-phosphosulfate (PAPS) 3'-phosphatase
MKNPTMVKEFSDGRQRYAVCLSLWRKRKKKK